MAISFRDGLWLFSNYFEIVTQEKKIIIIIFVAEK